MKNYSSQIVAFNHTFIFLLLTALLATSCSEDEIDISTIETELYQKAPNPYDILRLKDSDWKLQIPVAKSGASTCPNKDYKYGIQSISNSNLKTYTSDYFRIVGSSSNRVSFTTPGKGPTTSCGTTGTRTELRQNFEWNSNGNNTRTLKLKLRIKQFSDSGQLGFVQIHTGSDDLMIVLAQRVSSTSNQYYLKMRGDAIYLGRDRLDSSGFVISGTTGNRLKYTIDNTYEFRVSSGNNRIRVQIKNSSGNFYSLYDEPTKEDSGSAHFKAGCYILSNTNGNSQKGGTAKVEFYTVDFDS